MRSRRVRALLKTALGAVLLLAVVTAAGIPLYVLPPVAEVDEADLIYVIGPPTEERIALERTLRADGFADLSLYSVDTQGRYTADRVSACSAPGVVCVHPLPFTTKGEIAYLAEFAAAHDTQSTIVLTFTPHVARTRYIIDKCLDGTATVVAVDQTLSLGDWIYQYLYQSASFVKAWLTPCAEVSEL